MDMSRLQPGRWVQDPANYSWVYKDRDGTFIRVSKALTPDFATWLWGFSWSGVGGVVYRSSFLHATADEAKRDAERLFTSEPDMALDAIQHAAGV